MAFIKLMVSILTLNLSFGKGLIIITGAADEGGDDYAHSYPTRREINEFSQSGPPFDLFILALQVLQARNQSEPLSYFQIAGKCNILCCGLKRS